MSSIQKTRVFIIESERGWGQKVDEVIEFQSVEEAVVYCKEYNNKYNPPQDTTPSWYMYAEIEGRNELGLLR